MYALIQKSDNQILRVSSEGVTLASEKPFYWVNCPDNATTEWKFDGVNFTAPALPEVSLDQQFESVRYALQSAIDDKARLFGFSGGNALMLYVGFANPFQALAQQFATWEVSVWLEAEAYKQEVIAGNKPMLTPDQAVALMPEYPA